MGEGWARRLALFFLLSSRCFIEDLAEAHWYQARNGEKINRLSSIDILIN